MARLAAYYQEAFHYPSVGLGPKQKKAAYFFLEDSKGHLYSNYERGRDRIRGLAASEPKLADLDFQSRIENMTLKQRSHALGTYVGNNSHVPVSHIENFYSPTRFNQPHYDNESLYSYYEVPGNQYHINQKTMHAQNNSRKRFSYSEPVDMTSSSLLSIPEVNYSSRNSHILYPDNYYNSQSAQNYLCLNERYHQNMWHPHAWTKDSSFLSPPSPLDSGLSSHSITSSPSLETEQERLRGCSCPRVTYGEPRCLSRFDSGRSSPGEHSISQPSNMYPITRKKVKETMYAVTGFDRSHFQSSPVRYGKMGIVGEPLETRTQHSVSPDGRQHDFQRTKENFVEGFHVYPNSKGSSWKKTFQAFKPHKSSPNR